MKVPAGKRTATEDILLAAADLALAGRIEFTEWELTVAAWKRNRNRFGLRGFEDSHPDHKRVTMEYMSQSKQNGLVRRRFIEKTKPNYYRLTDLGRAEATVLRHHSASETESARSPGEIYVAIAPFAESPPFRAWLKDKDEPRSWLGAAAFLGLSRNTANELNDRIRAVETAARRAKEWCVAERRDAITRGASRGSKAIPLGEIERVLEFLDVLRERFGRQIEAIRNKTS